MSELPPPICDYEGSDYQARFWERGGREYEDRVEAVALRRLLPKGGQRLLEVGAGAGRNTLRYQGFDQIVLFDYSRTQLEQAKDRLGESERYIYVVGDVYRLPFAAAFDAATMIRTIHHLAEPLMALQQVREALKVEATFILEYANKQNLKAILRWFVRRQSWSPFNTATIEFAPLNFNFHPRKIQQWMAEANFEVEEQLTVSHFRVELMKRMLPLGLLVALDSGLQRTGSWWQLTPSVFLKAVAVGEGGRQVPTAFWRCPSCESIDLEEVEDSLQCLGCGRLWSLQDGIYDFKEPINE